MKCSIIIPYFQRKKTLFDTLKSLEEQENMKGQYEVILINDGSNDLDNQEIESLNLKIAIKYAKYERNEFSGISFARNRGIEQSSGDLLIFIDSDEIVNQDFVYQHYIFYQETQSNEILQMGIRKEIGNMNEANGARAGALIKYPDVREQVFDFYSQNMSLIKGAWHLAFGCNISVSRKVVEKYGGFDENFKGWGLEDSEFAYRLQKNGVRILYNPSIELLHQSHGEFGSEKYKKWEENLAYFIKKHNNELPVMLQHIFADCLDPMKRNILRKKGIRNYWFHSYQRFENCLRGLEGEEFHNENRPIILVNPEISKLKKYLAGKDNRQYIVFSSRINTTLISWVQLNKVNFSLRLFTY